MGSARRTTTTVGDHRSVQDAAISILHDCRRMRVVWLSVLLHVVADGFLFRPCHHAHLSERMLNPERYQQKRKDSPHIWHDSRSSSLPTNRLSSRQYRRLLVSVASDNATPSSTSASVKDGLILGLNKYSHDSAVCIISAKDGRCLFAGEKERLTRSKHDGGDTAGLVSHALESIGAEIEDVQLVVSNNHHHRVAPFEKRIPWAVAMGTYPESYAADMNLLPGSAHAELSHHLAHAWSAAALAPFDSGLIVVMDGMGEAQGAMAKAEAAATSPSDDIHDHGDKSNGDGEVTDGDSSRSGGLKVSTRQERRGEEYYNDLRLMRELGASGEMAEGAEEPGQGNPGFQQVPEALLPHEDYREAESAYTFVQGLDGGPPILTPIYKRWTMERSPPELFNHGFENMESLGAVYSRVSSHIFGDWNACGKVMGLAPWALEWPSTDSPVPPLTSGSLLSNRTDGDAFRVEWNAIEQLPRPNELEDRESRPFYAALAATAQGGLEDTAMAFITGLRERTGEKNVCLCGGVALNSVLNGKVAREAGFERVFVPPCPGDEGIAVGCAAFGWHQRRLLLSTAIAAPGGNNAPVERVGSQSVATDDDTDDDTDSAGAEANTDGTAEVKSEKALFKGRAGEEGELRAPFWGKEWSAEEVEDELEEWEPWLDVRDLDGVEEVAEAIANGEVVGWFQGKGEFGPRALGSRSLLADPRDPKMPSRINTDVKKREDFRPFAPSVLSEEAEQWFEGLPLDGSPYMSLTAPAAAGVAEKVPAVCHVDGSSRLQTVREEDNRLYHKLIKAFFERTGVPMVLNTSFNVMGEPIVDSPADAIRALIRSGGTIDKLVLHEKVVTLKPFPPDVTSDVVDDSGSEGGGDDGGGFGDDRWNSLVLYQARPFLSEVTGRGSGKILRVRVRPEDGRDEWIDLEGDFELQMLELAENSPTLAEMIEEIVEEQLSDLEDEDYDDDEELDTRYQDGADIDDEERESRAVATVTDDVLRALRSLYSKGLIAFDVDS